MEKQHYLPIYFSNAIEGDQIVWQHASATTVLLYSPDTDIYNIGLTKHSLSSTKQYIIQFNVPHSIQKKYLNLNNLIFALCNDPDLTSLSAYQTYKDLGFLSFLRLISTMFFKKHLPSLISLYAYETPQQLYNSTDVSLAPKEKHKMWLQKIRAIVSERILSEDERMPSTTALWHHWLRTTYICTL